MKKIFSVFLVIVSMFCLIGCTGNGEKTSDENLAYSIEFCVDGKTYTRVKTDGKKISMPRNPTKDNYEFDGWYWDNEKWEEQFTLNSMGNRPLTENMKYVVYAKWKGVEIQIIYDVQGGNALDEPNQTIQYGSNYKLAVPECTDGKKAFYGWYQKTDGQGKRYTDEYGNSLTECDFMGTLTVYAYWVNKKSHMVTFIYEGATSGNTPETATLYEGEEYTWVVPEKTGYAFQGWYNSPNGQGKKYTDETGKGRMAFGDEKDVTVYAYFKANNYTIYFDYQGGDTFSYVKEKKVEYGSLYTGAYTGRMYFEFQGWYDAPGGMGTQYLNAENNCLSPWTRTEDVTLYAYWKVHEMYDILTYQTTDNGECAVVGIKESASPNTIIIPEYHDGKKVTQVLGRFSGCTRIQMVYVACTVKEIAAGVFSDSGTYLEEVHFARPASLGVTKIDYSTFGYGSRVNIYVKNYEDITAYYEAFKEYYTFSKDRYHVSNL